MSWSKETVSNTTGNETGITVNGITAMVYGGQFVANHVPLTEGVNTITIAAKDTAENSTSTSITVTAATTAPQVTLTANTESGISPLTTYFSASTEIPNSATNYKMDFDGDGTNDYTGSTFDNISHTYSSPGIYYATLDSDR